MQLNRTTPSSGRPARRRARGLGLIDALIALAILAFGLLGLTRMQTSLVRQGTESQTRLTAAQLGDELLGTVRVDLGNVGCYTLPNEGSCTSVAARGRATDWKTRTLATLPGTVTAEADLTGDLFTVTITWTGKETGETRTLEATTDVRN